MTNEELVTAIRAGHRELAAALLEQNHGMMARMANQYLPLAERNRAADADDLMQEAAIGLLGAVDAWDEERGPFLPFSIYFMKRAIRNALGLNGRQRVENTAPLSLNSPVESKDGDETEFGDLLVDGSATDPQEEAEKADLRRIVRQAVNDLPGDQRDVLLARALGGVPRKMLAARMGLPEHRLVSLESAGRRALERNRRMYYLWQEYRSACDKHVGVTQFKATWTSATEAAVLRRDWLMKNKSVY